MNEDRFEQLLNGDQPTMADYAGFVSVIEKLPGELLWELANTKPAMHGLLKSAVLKRLQEAVHRENVDNALNAIVTKLIQGR